MHIRITETVVSVTISGQALIVESTWLHVTQYAMDVTVQVHSTVNTALRTPIIIQIVIFVNVMKTISEKIAQSIPGHVIINVLCAMVLVTVTVMDALIKRILTIMTIVFVMTGIQDGNVKTILVTATQSAKNVMDQIDLSVVSAWKMPIAAKLQTRVNAMKTGPVIVALNTLVYVMIIVMAVKDQVHMIAIYV